MKKKIIFLGIILCITFVISGCKTTSKYGNIMGIATLDGTPSSGITVTISGTNESTTTDANGGYSFSSIIYGSVVLSFTKDDYSTQTTTVVVIGGTTTIASAVNLSSSYGNITGTARLYGQTVYSGITVKIVESGVETTTDSSGSYLFSNVSSGTVTLVFSKSGYQSVTTNGIIVQSGSTTTVAVTTLQISTVQISTENITGVIDIAGETDDSGALVSIDGTTLNATSASDGSFTISGITTGTYDLTISKSGYITATTSDITVTSTQATELDTISIYKQADIAASYNMNSILSGTIQAMEEWNGYLYIATNTNLYKVSTTNPTSVINSITVTHNYLYLFSGTFGDDTPYLYGLADSYFFGVHSEDFSTANVLIATENQTLFDIFYDLSDFIFNSSATIIGFNKESNCFDQYTGDDDGGFILISSFQSPATNIKGIDGYGLYSWSKFFACNPSSIYKLNYNFTQYDVVRINNTTNLIGIGYSSPYIWVLDKDSKILYKVTDNLD